VLLPCHSGLAKRLAPITPASGRVTAGVVPSYCQWYVDKKPWIARGRAAGYRLWFESRINAWNRGAVTERSREQAGKCAISVAAVPPVHALRDRVGSDWRDVLARQPIAFRRHREPSARMGQSLPARETHVPESLESAVQLDGRRRDVRAYRANSTAFYLLIAPHIWRRRTASGAAPLDTTPHRAYKSSHVLLTG